MRRLLNLRTALARVEAPGGDLAVSAVFALLWLTILTGAWMVPNETPVPVRLGLTAWWSLLCGCFVVTGCARHREAIGRRRRRNGLCAACGYDLRATPGRCPECGRNDRTVSG